MATTVSNTNEIQSMAILYEAFRRSVWLNAANRSLEQYMARALRVSVVEVNDQSSVSDVTREQLEAPVTYTTSNVTEKTFEKKYFRGQAELAMADYRILEAGGRLESYTAEALGKKLALHVDDKIREHVASLTFDIVDKSGNDNLITLASADTLKRTFPYTPGRGQTAANVASAFKDAHMLLSEKDLIGGEYIGDGGPSAFSALGPVAAIRQIADYLASETQLQDNSNVGRDAEQSRGIFGTGAYRGTYAGIDLMATNSIPNASGSSGTWDIYILPTNSTLYAGFPMMMIDESKFGQGNTDGAFVYRRTAVGEYLVGTGRPESIVKIQIPSVE